MNRAETGIVFNVQRFSVHDGRGIRALVFFKGCPLRCQWCANPESQAPHPEKGFNGARCMGASACGRCAAICPSGAVVIADGQTAVDPCKCVRCFKCVRVCPGGAHIRYGERKSVDEVLAEVARDDVFYSRSGGGITLSGGEPLFQPDFALALLQEAKNLHIDTAMETCGAYDYKRLAAVAPYLDELIFDIKCADTEKHKRLTGEGNRRILGNLHTIAHDFPDLPLLVRTPIIPGCNDSEKDVRAIMDILPPRVNYELLPYHRFGLAKYSYLGRTYPIGDRELNMGKMEHLKRIAEVWRRSGSSREPHGEG